MAMAQVNDSTFWEKHLRYKVAALILLAVIAALVALTVLMYKQAFTSRAEVTVKTERAGLQMRSGTVVKLRGVDVGKIGDVRTDPQGGADMTLKLKPDMISAIPKNVHVSLEQLTAFGNKHVALTEPAPPSPARMRDGDVVDTRHVSVEVNDVFDKLGGVLDTLQPQKVNAMLGAIGQTVQGRGDRLGETIDRADSYLAKFNSQLPQLQRDFGKGAQVLGTYSDATPDLMRTLHNGTATSQSITAEQKNLDEALDRVTAFSRAGAGFLDLNGHNLTGTLKSALPTTTLLQRYSPEYSCFIQAMDITNKVREKSFGTAVPGVTANINFLPGNEPYKNPDNLPNMAANNGPRCYGMPNLDRNHTPPSVLEPFDKGGTTDDGKAPTNQDSLTKQPLAVQLFGPLVNLGGGRAQQHLPPQLGGGR